nr:GNAT family N-acetyltransferase [uncultured Cohaesibacter sp.]
MSTSSAPSPSPVLRSAKPDDAEAIAALKVICWQTAYKGLMPEASLEHLNAADEVPHWRNWLADETSGLIANLLFYEGLLVGYGLAGPMRLGDRPGEEIEADAELYALYVHPDYQRRSFGQKLLSELVGTIMAQGFGKIGAWMIGGNVKAEGFYKKTGAVELRKRVEIHHGRIGYREKAWIWDDLPKLMARLTLRSVKD